MFGRAALVWSALTIALVRAAHGANFETALDAYGRGDYTTAVKEFRPLAAQGDATAQYQLGVMYAKGQGVPPDPVEAAEWYRLAAEQGHPDAQNNLGTMYDSGQGVAQDFNEARTWYRAAAEQGIAEAQYNLGLMYDNGKGVPQDYGEAMKWYRLAAEQGNPNAQNNLGAMYAKGDGVLQDYLRAYKWLNLAAARLPLGEQRDRTVRNRDIVQKLMTPAQVAEAQRLVRDWEPKRLLFQRERIQRLQRALADLGYAPGPVDGIVGSQTRRAIEAFQRDTGRSVDGEATHELLTAAEAEQSARARLDRADQPPD